jgi:hypothetical protein
MGTTSCHTGLMEVGGSPVFALGCCRLEHRRGSGHGCGSERGGDGGSWRASPRQRLRGMAGAAGAEGESGAAEVLT